VAPQLRRNPLDGAGNLQIEPTSLMLRFSPLLVLMLVWGCGAGWHRPRAELPAPLPARQQVQIWRNGVALQWHAVRLTADSVSGISFLQPVQCDSCRVSVPRATVDSLRLGNPVAGFWKTMGLVTAIIFTPAIIYCWKGCSST
jgi:hypothetical protein